MEAQSASNRPRTSERTLAVNCLESHSSPSRLVGRFVVEFVAAFDPAVELGLGQQFFQFPLL